MDDNRGNWKVITDFPQAENCHTARFLNFPPCLWWSDWRRTVVVVGGGGGGGGSSSFSIPNRTSFRISWVRLRPFLHHLASLLLHKLEHSLPSKRVSLFPGATHSLSELFHVPFARPPFSIELWSSWGEAERGKKEREKGKEKERERVLVYASVASFGSFAALFVLARDR